jgi:sterol-4alpha-carboxylate 3-dehydrogenase (decarboxylating)
MSKSLGHVAIIGGCGFLGANLVELLLKQYPDTRVSALDIRTTLNRIDSPSITYYNVDITDLPSVEELFQKLKFDVVIHTAAMVPNTGTSNSVTYRVNVEGTKNLLGAAQKSEVKAFVYTSSSSVVVGDVWTVINADERWPVLLGREQPEYYSETKVRYF